MSKPTAVHLRTSAGPACKCNTRGWKLLTQTEDPREVTCQTCRKTLDWHVAVKDGLFTHRFVQSIAQEG